MLSRGHYPVVIIYTDGACAPNPGPGGWAAILRYESAKQGMVEKELTGREPITTSNRMELTAAVEALKALNKTCQVDIFTDSQYLHSGITKWLPAWMTRGWKSKTGEEIKNQDLWQLLNRQIQYHQVCWNWIKGHADDMINKRVDALARSQIVHPDPPEDDPDVYHLYMRASSRKGIGVWGAVVRYGNERQILSGIEEGSTTGKMELAAAIQGLRYIGEGNRVNAYTTSGYLYSGVILSVAEWVHNDWITTQPKKVQYKHLWQELLLLQELRNVVWYWVKEKTMSEDYDLAQKAVLGLLANRE